MLKLSFAHRIHYNSIFLRSQSRVRSIHELRPYQKDCIKVCLNEYKNGIRRQAISLPVGSGKTVIFSNLIKQLKGKDDIATKALVLAHREELIVQAANHIKRASPELIVDIDQGAREANPAADVIVASVPTLGRENSERLSRYDRKRFKCVIIDEAHHAAAETYMRVINHFALTEDGSNRNILIWGCSATLRRHDGLGLDRIFEKIVFHKPFLEMIREGWLCDIKAITVKTANSLEKVRKLGGDFATKSLSKAVNVEERNEAIVQAYKELAKGRGSTLIFAVDVNHASTLCEVFKKKGVNAAYLVGITKTWEREQILDDFKNKRLSVLINCGILTEGTDIPNIDCIMMARPTRSSILFQQMVGRGVRLYKGKKDCLVVDFVDIFNKKTELVTLPTLLGLDPSLALKETSVLDKDSLLEQQHEQALDTIKREKPESPEDRFFDAIDRAVNEESEHSTDPVDHTLKSMGFKAHVHLNPLTFFDLGKGFAPGIISPMSSYRALDAVSSGDPRLRGISKLAWVALSDNRYALQIDNTYYFVTHNEKNLWVGSKKARIQTNDKSGKGKYRVVYSKETELSLQADTLQHAIHGIDSLVSTRHNNFTIKRFMWNASWRNSSPTSKQISMLKRYGLMPSTKIEKFEKTELQELKNGNVSDTNVDIKNRGSALEDTQSAIPTPDIGSGHIITKGSATNLISRMVLGSGKWWKDQDKKKQKEKLRIQQEIDNMKKKLQNSEWFKGESSASFL